MLVIVIHGNHQLVSVSGPDIAGVNTLLVCFAASMLVASSHQNMAPMEQNQNWV
jgi:hypothetical protein